MTAGNGTGGNPLVELTTMDVADGVIPPLSVMGVGGILAYCRSAGMCRNPLRGEQHAIAHGTREIATEGLHGARELLQHRHDAGIVEAAAAAGAPAGEARPF